MFDNALAITAASFFVLIRQKRYSGWRDLQGNAQTHQNKVLSQKVGIQILSPQ